MKISRLFNSVPKRLAAGAIIALAVFLPAASFAADTVKIEADTTVANANVSSSDWSTATSASYDQVVDIQVVYNNDEDAASNKIANNLRVKINIPTTAGTDQTIATQTSSDNSNTVNGTAKVTLDRADAYLQYIPGTATWKHADSANGPMNVTQKVSDDVVIGANGLVIENENPCQAGSIQVQARVMVPGVKVTKQVEKLGESDKWATSNTANAGDTLRYRIDYQNTGNTAQQHVILSDRLPAGVTVIPGTTYLVDGSNPSGVLVEDTIAQGGIDAGEFDPGTNAVIVFNAKIDAGEKLECGANDLTNIAVVQPQSMQQYWNSATTTVNKTCNTVTPTYACTAFHVTIGDNRTVKVDTFTFTASDGSKLDMATLNWGDGKTLDTNAISGQSHKYAADGTHAISVLNFKVNGKIVDVSGNCSQSVTLTSTPTPPVTPPTVLPNTGAGDVIGIFAGVVAASTIGYRLFLSRKLAR